MYEEHPEFIQPVDDNIKVWRYMDIAKFVSLIDSSSLFFARIDKLDDPFEGSFPKMNIAAREIAPSQLLGESRDKYMEAMKSLSKVYKEFLRFHAVNCWHANEHESAAMWKLYIKSGEGIAVQSTYAKLRESFICEETVFLGLVKYLDYEREWINSNNMLAPYVHKRKSFEHEMEVRAVMEKIPSTDGAIDCGRESISHGINVNVDLKNLIEKVYISPDSPVWFGDLMRSVIRRYGYEFEVVQSKLSERPFY